MKLKKIISEEFVVIPDGRGGIRENWTERFCEN